MKIGRDMKNLSIHKVSWAKRKSQVCRLAITGWRLVDAPTPAPAPDSDAALVMLLLLLPLLQPGHRLRVYG